MNIYSNENGSLEQQVIEFKIDQDSTVSHKRITLWNFLFSDFHSTAEKRKGKKKLSHYMSSFL
jgi:hypothetical protein